MRQIQRTLVMVGALLLAAGALGLYAYYGVDRKDAAEAEKKAVQDHLFSAHEAGQKAADGGAPPAAVFTKVTLTSNGQTTVLERKVGAQWEIVSPVKAPADKLAVDGLLSQLQTAKFKEQIEENPDDAALAKYGLKQPKFSVSAEAYVPDESGKGADDPGRRREVALLGGIENTFDGSVYLQRKGQKTVYSAEGGVRWAFEKTTYDLREKELVTFDEPKVTAIEVAARANAFALARDDKKAWRLTRPLSSPADAATISSLVSSSLKSERALSFPDDTPENRKALGLDKPLADATFQLESGEKVRLRFFTPDADAGAKTYVLREGLGAPAFGRGEPLGGGAAREEPGRPEGPRGAQLQARRGGANRLLAGRRNASHRAEEGGAPGRRPERRLGGDRSEERPGQEMEAVVALAAFGLAPGRPT